MIALKITLALIFAFFLFIGAFIAISRWIFDKVEISDHLERLRLQQVNTERGLERKRQRKIYY